MRNNDVLKDVRISPIIYSLYLIMTILAGVCINYNSNNIFYICGNRPRYMQFVWMTGLVGMTAWKAAGSYILRGTRTSVQFFCNLIIDIILFISQYRILSKLGLPISLSIIILILLGLIAAIQSNNKIKRIHKIAMLMAYIIAGGIYTFANGNAVLWKNDYSVFSHIFMLGVCSIIFCILSGTPLKIEHAFIKDLLKHLTLD